MVSIAKTAKVDTKDELIKSRLVAKFVEINVYAYPVEGIGPCKDTPFKIKRCEIDTPFKITNPENHTLSGRISTLSSYKGVPPLLAFIRRYISPGWKIDRINMQ